MDVTDENNDSNGIVANARTPSPVQTVTKKAAETEDSTEAVKADEIVKEGQNATATEPDKVMSAAAAAAAAVVKSNETVEKTVEAVADSSEKMEVYKESQKEKRVDKEPAADGATRRINFDTDSDSIEELDGSVHKSKRVKVYTDWVCVNPQCTLNGKSNSEMVATAKPFVLGHYGKISFFKIMKMYKIIWVWQKVCSLRFTFRKSQSFIFDTLSITVNVRNPNVRISDNAEIRTIERSVV